MKKTNQITTINTTDTTNTMLECVVVLSKEQIKIVFKDGTEIDQSLT